MAVSEERLIPPNSLETISMRRFNLTAVAACAILAAFSTLSRADESNDPTGTWKWSVTFNNQSRDFTLKLKLDGDKLTGAMLGRNNQERPIEDATYKDGEVEFKITRERNGQKFTVKYKGKVSGDTIKGKSEFERNGQAQSRDWEAKREKT